MKHGYAAEAGTDDEDIAVDDGAYRWVGVRVRHDSREGTDFECDGAM